MLIDQSFVKTIIRSRPRMSHKGDFGKILLIGGSYPYGGAILMAALACVNSGAGLVTVATDRDNIVALHSQLPEAMALNLRDTSLLKEQMKAVDVLLIGPGLGETSEAEAILDLVLTEVQECQILIVDGSALNILSKKQAISWPTKNLILTPHQKEWERLSGIAIEKQNRENTRASLVNYPEGTVLVAKSYETKIYQGERLAYFKVGGPYQATEGMGDTLAGMIAGFVGQFSDDLFASTAAATYVHSAIADELAQESYVVLPTAISGQIAKWMKKLSGK